MCIVIRLGRNGYKSRVKKIFVLRRLCSNQKQVVQCVNFDLFANSIYIYIYRFVIKKLTFNEIKYVSLPTNIRFI